MITAGEIESIAVFAGLSEASRERLARAAPTHARVRRVRGPRWRRPRTRRDRDERESARERRAYAQATA